MVYLLRSKPSSLSSNLAFFVSHYNGTQQIKSPSSPCCHPICVCMGKLGPHNCRLYRSELCRPQDSKVRSTFTERFVLRLLGKRRHMVNLSSRSDCRHPFLTSIPGQIHTAPNPAVNSPVSTITLTPSTTLLKVVMSSMSATVQRKDALSPRLRTTQLVLCRRTSTSSSSKKP